MMSPRAIRYTLGIIGNVISFGLFFSPGVTFWRIIKKKSVEEFKPDPYVATILNCAFWVLYGLPFVHPDNILVSTINGIGLVIEFTYVGIFLFYADWPKRNRILLLLLGEAILFVLVLVLTLVIFHTTDKRTIFIGAFCVVFNIAMYFSPLTVIAKVVRTRSVKYMPFLLTLACFLNGAIWTSYALIRIDWWMLIPNGLGTLSGIIQLGLYGWYRNSSESKAQSSQVELPPKTVEV